MNMKLLIVAASCLLPVYALAETPFPLTAVRSIDGSGQALGGAAGTPLFRVAPADYPADVLVKDRVPIDGVNVPHSFALMPTAEFARWLPASDRP